MSAKLGAMTARMLLAASAVTAFSRDEPQLPLRPLVDREQEPEGIDQVRRDVVEGIITVGKHLCALFDLEGLNTASQQFELGRFPRFDGVAFSAPAFLNSLPLRHTGHFLFKIGQFLFVVREYLGPVIDA